jgi:hypothetical protein
MHEVKAMGTRRTRNGVPLLSCGSCLARRTGGRGRCRRWHLKTEATVATLTKIDIVKKAGSRAHVGSGHRRVRQAALGHLRDSIGEADWKAVRMPCRLPPTGSAPARQLGRRCEGGQSRDGNCGDGFQGEDAEEGEPPAGHGVPLPLGSRPYPLRRYSLHTSGNTSRLRRDPRPRPACRCLGMRGRKAYYNRGICKRSHLHPEPVQRRLAHSRS